MHPVTTGDSLLDSTRGCARSHAQKRKYASIGNVGVSAGGASFSHGVRYEDI